MRVLSRKATRDSSAAHPEWRASLESWYKITQNADWKKFDDVRQTFNTADHVGKYVVFDIAHNRCRVITTIKYNWAMVYVRAIVGHAEYDRGKWEDQ